MEVVLDTSHSLLVVASSNSELCAGTPLGCLPPGSSNATSLGSFNASASSTYKSTGKQFNITALELGNVSGDLVQDQLTLGTATVDMTFGLENLSADYLLGIGYSLNNTYTSLPQALLESRQINSAAYSLWMDGQNGTVLFGGVNTAKYTGDLYTMSIPAVSGTHYLPTVLVTNCYKCISARKLLSRSSHDIWATNIYDCEQRCTLDLSAGASPCANLPKSRR